MFCLLTRIRANIASLLLFLLLLITAQDCYSALRNSKSTINHHAINNGENPSSNAFNEHDIDFINTQSINQNANKNNEPFIQNHHPFQSEPPKNPSPFNADIPEPSFESILDIPKDESFLKQKDSQQQQQPRNNPSASSVPQYLPDCSSDEAIKR